MLSSKIKLGNAVTANGTGKSVINTVCAKLGARTSKAASAVAAVIGSVVCTQGAPVTQTLRNRSGRAFTVTLHGGESIPTGTFVQRQTYDNPNTGRKATYEYPQVACTRPDGTSAVVPLGKYLHCARHGFKMFGRYKRYFVHHIDGNPFNCTEDNILFMDISDKHHNLPKRKGTRSPYKGLVPTNPANIATTNWRGQVTRKGKTIVSEPVEDAADAAALRDHAASALYVQPYVNFARHRLVLSRAKTMKFSSYKLYGPGSRSGKTFTDIYSAVYS